MVEFSKTYITKDEHIDVQQIMDGLYYPFYMESCRHDFIREILGFDFAVEAEKGVYMVLSQFSIKFVRSLKKSDEFVVTCVLYRDATNQPKLHFMQTILLNKKIMTTGIFTGTCVPAAGGRPFLPLKIQLLLPDLPTLAID